MNNFPENGESETARLARIVTAARHKRRPLLPEDAGALVAECLELAGPGLGARRDDAIRDASCGIVAAYLDLGLDSAAAVVAIVRALPNAVPELDPAEAMTLALDGAAVATFGAGREQRDKCFNALDAALYGAADVFMRACERRAPRPA